MSTHFDDIERQARSLPLKRKAALARSLSEELDQSVDTDTEHLRITSHVDPHDLDTAARCHKMIKTNGYSVEGLAKKAKKCKTVIRDWLHLDKLPDVARRAFRNSKISKSICALIVTIPEEKRRAKFAKEVLTGGEHGEPMSFRVAKQWKANHYMKELKGAPFPLDDATLDPEWGSTCTKGSCQYWNGNTSERRQGKRADICLKPDHYTKLVRLNAARVIANATNPTR